MVLRPLKNSCRTIPTQTQEVKSASHQIGMWLRRVVPSLGAILHKLQRIGGVEKVNLTQLVRLGLDMFGLCCMPGDV